MAMTEGSTAPEAAAAPMAPLVIGGVVCDPPVVLAPMAAITNPPFRLICRSMGAGLVVTEMMSAEGLAHRGKKTLEMLDIRPDEHPVSVQIYGKHPEMMARAAAVIEDAGADMVDINMGCPMRKVVSSGHGAALLLDPSKVYRIIKAMTEAVSIPVTAKIRAGFEDSNAATVARAVEDAGGAAVTIHGRTRREMFEGHPDLAVIAELEETVSIPVIGNGDVRDVASALAMMGQTGCAGVMVARGCMGYPWIFRELNAAFAGLPIPPPPTLEERREVVREHARLYAETYGERRTVLEIRKHLLWYFRQTPGEEALKAAMAGLATMGAVYDAIDVAVEVCAAAEGTFAYPRGLERHPNRRPST